MWANGVFAGKTGDTKVEVRAGDFVEQVFPARPPPSIAFDSAESRKGLAREL